MPWPLYLALKQLFPSGRTVSFFALVSLGGVAVGVGLLVVVLGLMNGFQREIRQQMVDRYGHIEVHGDGILSDPESIVQMARTLDGVEAANPYIQGPVMIQHSVGGRTYPTFPVVRSIDVNAEAQVLPVNEYLPQGITLEDLDDERVLIGRGLARKLRADVGSVIEVFSPELLNEGEELLLPVELEVVGVFETGWSEVDENTLLVTLRTMRDLYGFAGERAHAVALRLSDPDQAPSVARALNTQLPDFVRALTWLELNQSKLFILGLEKVFISLITAVILFVAVFNITVFMITTVVRKTREIGLLGALGGRRRSVASVFVMQGLFLGLAGSALGVGAGLLLLDFRSPITRVLARIGGNEDLIYDFYQFVELPVFNDPMELGLSVLIGIGAAVAGSSIAALLAARLRPAEALRYE
ncbi:MAG: ABC transporter permease [Opitutales bacterium]